MLIEQSSSLARYQTQQEVAARRARGEPLNDVSTTYQAEGVTQVSAAGGRWTFSYSTLSVGGSPLALAFRFENQASNSVEIDWTRTVLVSPSGQTQPMIHKGRHDGAAEPAGRAHADSRWGGPR